ncbi:MAG: site-specific integrase [Candidatus Thermoplasmatota archaeon]
MKNEMKKRTKDLRPEEEKKIFENEYKQLLNYADRETSLIMQIMYELGLRIGEILKLKGKDVIIDLAKDIKEIHCIQKGGNPHRVVIWNEDLARNLLYYIKENNLGSDDFIFPARYKSGKYRDPKTIPRSIKWMELTLSQYAKNLGLRHIHPHMFRHACASWMCDLGLTPLEISSFTGHRNISTLQRYAHPKKEALASKIEALIKKKRLPEQIIIIAQKIYDIKHIRQKDFLNQDQTTLTAFFNTI